MRICQAEGGYLAIINSEEEAVTLRKLWKTSAIYTTHDTSIFVGIHRWGLDDHFWTIHGKNLPKIYITTGRFRMAFKVGEFTPF